MVAATAIAVVALGGCALVEQPPGPTDDEIAAYSEGVLLKTWLNTGLEGIVERPNIEAGAALEQGDWFDAIFACMYDQGFESVGIGTTAETGAMLYDDQGGPVADPIAQLAFYRCAAAHPMELTTDRVVVTERQLDFVYDYYASWLVPCIVDHGYQPRDIPTRSRFHQEQGVWTPYTMTRLTEADRSALVGDCGTDRPLTY